MNKSNPGKKLSESLKSVIDPIFKRDPKRYANICRWVWTQQRRGFADESIESCIRLAGPSIHNTANWWAYLTKLMPKGSARAHEEENNAFKKGDLNQFGVILKKIVNEL